ncbi:MAG: hypothetical protein KJ620_08590 [Candidatus Edwardsbacteria bacterium]|nr:hypothetical protein [Candidatus Edwardsbacteria bacterium]MBU1576777.1 hypothetical protein [Candidatus Edwardsbacteria bacterium]
MMKNMAQIICPHCRTNVFAYRSYKGRTIITTGSALVLGIAGGLAGLSLGIASRGGGLPAAVPFSVMGLVAGTGLGYMVSDKIADKPTCPKCGEVLHLCF